MILSIFLAKLLGLSLIILCVGLLANYKYTPNLVRDVLSRPAPLFITGMINLLGGLAIVLAHNIWRWDWPVLITLLGWSALIQGILRLVFPEHVARFASQINGRALTPIIVVAAVYLLIGLFLTYKGFSH